MNKTLLIITIFFSATLSQTSQADAANQLMNRDLFLQHLGPDFVKYFDAAQPALQNMLQSGSAPTAPVPTPVPVPAPTQQFDLSALFGQAPTAPAAQATGGFNPYLPSTPHSHTIPVDVSASAARPGASTVSVQPTNQTTHTHPHSHSGGMSNPFLPSSAPAAAPVTKEVVLVYDKEAMPIFHPKEGGTYYVPNYPPIEGQHWYPYKQASP